MIDDFTPSTDSQTSAQSSLSSNMVQYITTPNSRGKRLRFGSTVDVRLPEEYRVQSHHFNIFVNDCPSWMMHVIGKTNVNGERLRSTQVALDPEIENTVQIGSLMLSIFIIRSPSESTWPQTSDPFLSNLPRAPEPQTETSSSASKLSHKSSKKSRPPGRLIHILNENLGSHPSRSRVRRVIHRKTGESAVGKLYHASHISSARDLFESLFTIMKISSS